MRQSGIAVVRPQHAIAQPVEGADPHAAGVDRQHPGNADEHFPRGLVGKGHCQQSLRTDLPGLNQPSDAGGEHAGLAGSGTREDQCRLVGKRNGFELLRIEAFEKRHAGYGTESVCNPGL